MPRAFISPRWTIALEDGSTPAIDATTLIQLLSCIKKEGTIAAAGRASGLSYRHAWGILRDAERLFGTTLIVKQPGKGTRLSELADILIQAEARLSARLQPTLASLASELESELRRAMPARRDPVRLFASHGFAVESLLAAAKQKQVLVEIRYRNSSEALAALISKECHLAGFHVPEGEFEEPVLRHYRNWLSDEHALIHLATRCQGLFVARGNPRGIRGLEDLRRLRFVNRQSGSGTRMLMEMMLRKCAISPQDINGFETTEFTHAAVAAYIASGMADVGFGIEAAARKFDLHFIPLVQERYFFAVKLTDLATPGVQHMIDLLQDPTFLSVAKRLEGYDVRNAGTVLSLQEAFPGRFR
jgi:molybdate transport repressor ModE-like protein